MYWRLRSEKNINRAAQSRRYRYVWLPPNSYWNVRKIDIDRHVLSFSVRVSTERRASPTRQGETLNEWSFASESWTGILLIRIWPSEYFRNSRQNTLTRTCWLHCAHLVLFTDLQLCTRPKNCVVLSSVCKRQQLTVKAFVKKKHNTRWERLQLHNQRNYKQDVQFIVGICSDTKGDKTKIASEGETRDEWKSKWVSCSCSSMASLAREIQGGIRYILHKIQGSFFDKMYTNLNGDK
jgi:hypothetical protein